MLILKTTSESEHEGEKKRIENPEIVLERVEIVLMVSVCSVRHVIY